MSTKKRYFVVVPTFNGNVRVLSKHKNKLNAMLAQQKVERDNPSLDTMVGFSYYSIKRGEERALNLFDHHRSQF